MPIPLPDDRPELRLSDADRSAAADYLRHHFGEGRLTMVEMEERLEAVFAARTRADLDGLFDDLPAPEPVAPARSGPPVVDRIRDRRSGLHHHVRSYVLVNLLLVAIWLMTTPGGYFWPMWVIVPWGFGVAMHVTTCRNDDDRGGRADPASV